MLSGCHPVAVIITELITDTLQISGDQPWAGGVGEQTGSNTGFAGTPEDAQCIGWQRRVNTAFWHVALQDLCGPGALRVKRVLRLTLLVLQIVTQERKRGTRKQLLPENKENQLREKNGPTPNWLRFSGINRDCGFCHLRLSRALNMSTRVVSLRAQVQISGSTQMFPPQNSVSSPAPKLPFYRMGSVEHAGKFQPRNRI